MKKWIKLYLSYMSLLILHIYAILHVAGCGDAPTNVNSVTGDDKAKDWNMGAAYHPNLLLEPNIPTDVQLTNILVAAGLRWRNDDDGPATDEKDVAVNVKFNYFGPRQEFLGKWALPQYWKLPDEPTLDELMETPEIKEWILLVGKTPVDSDKGRAFPGHARIVIPVAAINDNGIYAHELGHNANLLDRNWSSGNNCTIMHQAPIIMERVYANPDERDKMMQWVYKAPWD